MFDNFYQFKCPRKVIPLHLDYHGSNLKKDREFQETMKFCGVGRGDGAEKK